MKSRRSNTINLAIVLFGILAIPMPQVHAQTSKEPYAVMAPLAEYLMADRPAEIQLARSAAPSAISESAEVLVLGLHGYETAVKGTNGFVCLIERSWTGSFEDPEFWNPKIRSPICFNPAAARSVVPWTYKKTEMVLAGFSKTQIAAGIKSALDKKEMPAVEVGSMSFMMSRLSYLGDSIGHGPAHLMFFGPNRPDGAGWGENLPGSPIFRFGEPDDSSEPVRTYIIPVSKWSDGEPVSTDGHKH